MKITSAFVLGSVRRLTSLHPSTARAALVLMLAIIAVFLAIIAFQAAAPEPVIVAPLRWSS